MSTLESVNGGETLYGTVDEFAADEEDEDEVFKGAVNLEMQVKKLRQVCQAL